jgi:hypothetical protein
MLDALGILQILLVIGIAQSVKLQAFDCSMRNGANFSEVSLLNVAPCNNISARYDMGENTRIQIIQKVKKKEIDTINCQLRISIETAYCKNNQIYSRVWNGIERLTNEPVQISKSQCTEAFINKKLSFNDDGRFASLGPIITIDLRDDLTGDGVLMIRGNESLTKSNCEPDAFSFLRQHFESHLLRLKYHAIVQRTKGILNFKKGKIILANHLATRRTFDGEAYDTKEGSFFWNPINLFDGTCLDHVEAMWAFGKVYRPLNHNQSHPIVVIFPDGSNEPYKVSIPRFNRLTPYQVKYEGSQLAITLKGEKQLCNHQGFSTHIDEISVILSKKKEDMIKLNKITGEDVDKLINLKAILGSTYFSSELRVSASFDTVAKTLCEQSRTQMYAKLSHYALRNVENQPDTRHKGKLIIRGGSMVYLLSCKMVEVELRKNESTCYEDVPITYYNEKTKTNESIFMNPITYNMKPESRPVQCSTVIPNKFGLTKTDGKIIWICLTPKVIAGGITGGCLPPPELDPLQIDPFHNPNFRAIEASLYDKEQLDSIDAKQWENTHEGRSLTEFVKLMGNNNRLDTETSLQNMFTNVIEKSKHKIQEHIFPTIFTIIIFLVENLYSLMLISFGLNIIHGIVCLAIRAKKMYESEKGISCKMLLTISGGLFFVAIPLKHKCPCQDEQFQNELKEEVIKSIKEVEREEFMKRVFT